MKILIIRTFPDILNLDTYNVQEIGLAKALNAKGNSCDIVLFNGRQADKKEIYRFYKGEREYQFNIYWLRGFNILKNGFMPSLKKIIPFYDVIQVHEYDQITSWSFYTKQKKPTIIYHGPYYDAFAKGYNLKCKLFDMFFLPRRNISNVVAVTKSKLAADFLQKKGFHKIITAGVGINIENMGVSLAKKYSKQCDKKSLLYIGKLEERRNLFFLIEVFRELCKRENEVKLMIIGNGDREYKERLLDYIQDEINTGSIVYKESIQQKELISYYNEAGVFLLPSYYEIFGMVLLEAMYLGVPVVSSINGGATTLIQDQYNGFLIKEFDKNQWADCIQKVIKDEDLYNKIRKNARRTIESSYTWDALSDRFLEAYEMAVGNFERTMKGK